MKNSVSDDISISILNPLPEDMNSYRTLFGTVFGHPEYFDFFTTLSRDDAYLVSANAADGSLLGMLYLLPCMLKNKADFAMGYYMYSVCVSPEARGRGIFKRMCAFADSFVSENKGEFLALIPADKKLFETYKRLGYNLPIPGRVPTGADYDTASKEDATSLLECDIRLSQTAPNFIMARSAQPFTRKNADKYSDFPLFEKGLMKLTDAAKAHEKLFSALPSADNFPE